MSGDADQLDFYMFSYDQGLRASVTYDTRFEEPSERDAYPHGRRVILYSQSLTSEHVHENLLPLESELSRWRGLEKSLRDALDTSGVRYVKAGHMIYGGLCDILFQTAEPDAFDRVYQRWMSDGERGRVESRESAGWAYYEEKIQPKDARRLWSANAKTIEALRAAGLDVERPQAIEHHLFGDMPALHEAAAFIKALMHDQRVQVTVTPSSSGGDERGQLTVTVSIVLDPELVSAQEWQFQKFASELGVEYDGWGAHVGAGAEPPRAASQHGGREGIRAQAAAIVQRLELAGYDNASIDKVDAWIDSDACRQALKAPLEEQKDLIDSLGAYLGEAVIRRHGGKWDLAGERPMVVVKRNGAYFVDPIGKVVKRLNNGKEDDLLSLVNLVGHLASGALNRRSAPSSALPASSSLAPTRAAATQARTRGVVLLLIGVLVVLPFVLTVIIMLFLKAC